MQGESGAREAPAADGELRFGPAGWSYPDWRGPVYGGPGPRGLALLAEVFDTVEINTTFYRSVSPEMARGWLRQVRGNPRFRFTAKLLRDLTHQGDLSGAVRDTWLQGIEPLRERGRLGALLAQFPWSFRRSERNQEHLMRLLGPLGDFPVVVEFRHASWDVPATLEGLREAGVGFCNLDQPRLAGCLGPTEHVTSGVAYLRLHGRNHENWFRDDSGRDARYDYRYATTELEPLASRVRELVKRARQVFVITNNHFQGSAVVNALELRHLCTGACSRVPQSWLRSFPALEAVCRPRGGDNLELFPKEPDPS